VYLSVCFYCLPEYFYIFLLVCPCIYPSVSPVCLSIFYLPSCLSVHLSVCFSCLPVCLSIFISTFLSVRVSIRLFLLSA
jgi:hypothetical protein